MKKINERLRSYRSTLGLSQEYIAKQLGVSRTTITSIESGDRKVSALELNEFSRIYGVPIDEIVNGIQEEGSDTRVFARAFDELSDDDKKEIMNLIDFKRRLKESLL